MGARISFGGKDSVGPIVDALNRRLEKMETNLGDVSKQSKITSRDAEALWKKAQSPLDRYNDTVKRAKALLDGTSEGQRKYSVVVDAANKKLSAQSQLFGPTLTSKITTYATGLLGAAGAIGAVTSAFRGMSEAATAAGQSVAGAVDPRAKLAQLAGGDVGTYKRLLSTAGAWHKQGVGESRGQAEQLLFAIRSAGAGGEEDFLKRLAISRAFGDVPQLVGSGKALQTSLGRRATGSLQQTISSALAASGHSPTEVSALLEASAKGGGSAAALGIGVDELLAATAISSTATGSAERGGTRTAAFLRQIDKAGRFKGIGLIGTLRSLQTHERGGGDIRDILGSESEGIAGYRDVSSNLEQLQQILSEAKVARSTNLAARTAGLVSVDPQVNATIQRTRARNQADQSMTNFGIGAMSVETAGDYVRSRLSAMPDPLMKMWGQYALPWIESGLTGMGVGTGNTSDPSRFLRKIQENTQKQAERTGGMSPLEY